jgi:hypothetical protein
MIQLRDFMSIMVQARALSTFGPDFEKPVVIKAWHAKLQEISIDDMGRALTKLSGDREFPTANEILDFCKDLNQESELLPEVAFELLWKKIGSVGAYGHPELPNEIGLAVERLGGWQHICNTWEDDKRTWHEKEFRDFYGNITETKARGLLTQTSRYAPQALKGEKAKQISPGVKEALRMAMSGRELPKQKLNDIVKNMKSIDE